MIKEFEENRRILAVDDDPLVIARYQRMFAGDHSKPDSGMERLFALDRPPSISTAPSESLSHAASERKPYRLDCFSQGLDAVDAVEQSMEGCTPYAVALIDMRMPPGIDGFETAQRIRASDPHVQIIFVTAYSDHGTDSIVSQITGPVLWFSKPFVSEELYQTVRNSCVGWNHTHELLELRKGLSARVAMQTERMQQRMQEMELMQKNTLEREQAMGLMKDKVRFLSGYHDLRQLLSTKPLPVPKQVWEDTEESKVSVLLVQAENEREAVVMNGLEKIGFQVYVARNIDEGFTAAINIVPDLAIVDSDLMGGNGDKLIQLLRDDHRTHNILPLMLTTEEEKLAAIQSGALYWLVKEQPSESFLQKMALIRDYIQRVHHSEIIQEAIVLAEQDLQEKERHRVLVIDDEQKNLDAVQGILTNLTGTRIQNEIEDDLMLLLGEEQSQNQQERLFDVDCVLQGNAGVAAVLEAEESGQPYALVMLDMRMPPGIDGLETARQIRQISPDIEVVLFSAYSDHSLSELQEVLGLNFSFMSKPFHHEEVLQRVVEGCSKWDSSRKFRKSHRALLNLAEDMEQEIVRRKEAERFLEQANKTKDNFLSSMSHELRTPLTTMIGYNEIIAEDERIDSEIRGMAGCSLQAGKTLLQLVNDILDMSKIRAGKFELSEQPFDVKATFNEVTQLMSVYGSENGVSVDFTFSKEVEPLLAKQWIGDEMRLSQVLFNLLSNAVKFSKGGRTVRLNLRATQNQPMESVGMKQFVITVEDDGIGMSEQVRSRLFTPFEQADSSTSRRFGGTGLGLYITHQLIELMGGSIRVESTEKSGSTFFVTLPLRATDLAIEKVKKVTERLEVPRLQGEILLAEDTIQLQKLTTLLVEKTGATVDIANNGEEALEMASRKPYQLILMDMQMPKMDGIEATRRLREQRVETPIVALTANVMQKHKEMFVRAGCDGFVSKPIQRPQLYAALSEYLLTVGESSTSAPRSFRDDTLSEPEDDLSSLMNDEMMQEFWDYIAEAKIDLEQSWELGDWDKLRRTAHAIKGMGSSFGQPEMTNIAARIQNSALTGDRGLLEEDLKELLLRCTQGGS